MLEKCLPMACLAEVGLLNPNLLIPQVTSLKMCIISQSASVFSFDPHANNDFCQKPLLTLHLLFLQVFDLLNLIVREWVNAKGCSQITVLWTHACHAVGPSGTVRPCRWPPFCGDLMHIDEWTCKAWWPALRPWPLHTWGCTGFSSIPSAFSGALLNSHTARICLWLESHGFVWCQLRTWSCLLGGGWGGVCHHPLGSSISQMMAGCTESLDFVGDALFFPKGRNVFRDLCFRWDVESGLLAWQRSNGLLSKHKQQFILELRLLWNDSGCWTQTLFRYFKNKQTEAGWNWILPCRVLSCLHGIDSICEGFVLGATKRTCIG